VPFPLSVTNTLAWTNILDWTNTVSYYEVRKLRICSGFIVQAPAVNLTKLLE